jgi:hypothetical protein
MASYAPGHTPTRTTTRSSRVRWLAALACVIALLAASAALFLRDRKDAHVAVVNASTGPTTTSTDTTLATTTSETLPDSVVSVVESSTTVPPKSTTTSLVCRNSYDPACGDFYWDPPPPTNQPITLQVTPSATEVSVGQEVTLSIVADDPDATLKVACMPSGPIVRWGDPNQNIYACDPGCPEPGPRHGAWDTPAPEPGHFDGVEKWTYNTPGTYTVNVYVSSSQACAFGYGGYSPYGSYASTVITITVN